MNAEEDNITAFVITPGLVAVLCCVKHAANSVHQLGSDRPGKRRRPLLWVRTGPSDHRRILQWHGEVDRHGNQGVERWQILELRRRAGDVVIGRAVLSRNGLR
jgi:hypothetical protein